MCRSLYGVLLFSLLSNVHAFQRPYPPQLPGSRAEVYKSVDGVDLSLWVYELPTRATEKRNRPVIVFFFGGGWKSGSPSQFEAQCRYLASRGMVAVTADYRVATRHGVKAKACVEDAKSAVRWLRENADRLGIDPNRICAGGGSAGGHTACCTALIEGLDAANEDTSVSSVPDALALFNPAVMIAPLDGFDPGIDEEKWSDIQSRTGIAADRISPIHHVRKNLPPSIIFHGMADTTVPFSTVEEFSKRMNAAGNRCELSGFAEAPHGFFNAPRGNNVARRDRSDQWYRRTVVQLDRFLNSLGWLDGEPTLRVVDDDFVSLRGDMRNSLRRFQGRKGHVAFLGGSITEMDGYRPRVCEWLQKQFPETKFTFTNAGIASTCSNTGAFRLRRDVLSKGTVDLVFVEFAVNDDQDAAHDEAGCLRGMEGVVRQIREFNPNADIVITHFVNPGMLKTLESGGRILSASQHERVAQHYGIPSVYLSKVVASKVADGSLTWKKFGGTHPGPIGNQLAADLATSVLSEGWRVIEESPEPRAHALPQQLLEPTAFTSGELLTPEVAAKNGWEFTVPDWGSIAGSKRSRFTGRPMLHCVSPGAETSFQFEGTAIGAYVTAGPDAGQVEVQIDAGEWKTIELFHRFSKGLHYPRTVLFATGLGQGTHSVKMRVGKSSHRNSKGNAVRIIAFAVNRAT